MKFYLLLFLSLISGCATVVDFQKEEVNSEITYPPISILVNDGNIKYTTSCMEFGCYTFSKKDSYYILRSLNRANKFQNVAEGHGPYEYRVNIEFTRSQKDSGGVLLSKILIGAVTLFLIPIPSDADFVANFEVLKGKEKIASYRYLEEKQELIWILQSPNRNMDAAAGYFISKFIKDLEKEKIFGSSSSDTRT